MSKQVPLIPRSPLSWHDVVKTRPGWEAEQQSSIVWNLAAHYDGWALSSWSACKILLQVALARDSDLHQLVQVQDPL